MNLCFSRLSGAGLVDMTLKALLVVAIAGCFNTMLRRAAASTRHAIWLAAIALLITLPLAAVASSGMIDAVCR